MNVIINDNIIKVKVCSTFDSIKEGMMGKNFNHTFNGMLFMMPELTEQSFWMYNCIVPLDIIMIDNNKITQIHSNCPPCEDINQCASYKGFGNMVLELPGNYCTENGIKKGDNVSFSLY